MRLVLPWLIVLATGACDPAPQELIADTANADTGPADDAGGDVPEDDSEPLTTLTVERGYDPAQHALCAPSPAETFGRIAWISGQTLHVGRPGETPELSASLGLDAKPRSPVALGANFAPTSPALALAVDHALGTRLDIYGHGGDLMASVDRPNASSLPPLAGGTHLVWPLVDETAPRDEPRGSIAWVELARRVITYELVLPASPTTPAVAFGPGLVSGGGSHWVVGTSQGVLIVADRYVNRRLEDGPIDPQVAADQPRIVGRLDLGQPVHSLIVLGDHVVVTHPRGDQWVLAALRVDVAPPDARTFEPVDEVILPGRPTAHPVGFACNDQVGRAWFCQREVAATVVVGGDGWLFGVQFPGGVTTPLSDLAITWTGLALGRGGWVAGGGSHWVPAQEPEEVLYLLRPGDGARRVASHPAASPCVPSPLWGSDGALVVPTDGASLVASFETALTGPLGLAVGMPRPQGDNTNSSRPPREEPTCPDGQRRGLLALPLSSEEIYGVRPLNRFGAIFHGSVDGAGFFDVLRSGFDPPQRVTIADTAGIDFLEVHDGELAAAVMLSTGEVVLDRYTDFTRFLHRTGGVAAPPQGAILGVLAQGAGRYLVAHQPATVVLVAETVGRLDAVDFGDAPNGASTFHLLRPMEADPSPGGVMVVASPGNGVVVRRIDGDLAEVAVTRDDTLANPQVVGATLDLAGNLRLVVEDTDALSSPSTWLWHFDTQLARVASIPLPDSGDLATMSSGDSLVQSSAGSFRVSRDGAVGLPVVSGDGLLAPPRSIGVADSSFAIAYERRSPDRQLILARADAAGFLTCLQVGACMGANADLCDTLAPCVASSCEPTTGTCAQREFEGCQP